MKKIGGQAVIEGVMIRCENKLSIATINGNRIKVKKERLKLWSDTRPWLKWPLIRGVVGMVEMLIVGMRALMYSASVAGEEDEKLSTRDLVLTMAFAVVVTIGVFILLPLYLTKILTSDRGIVFNAIDGLLRVIFFVVYIMIISLSKDVRRIFEFHGAEHMTIHCYEHGKPLTVQNVEKFRTQHLRCGTSFLIIVVLISIVVFSLIISPNFWVKFVGRIILIPVIAGISYELLQLSHKYERVRFFRIISAPGVWLQYITTKKPNKAQIRTAIAAVKAVL